MPTFGLHGLMLSYARWPSSPLFRRMASGLTPSLAGRPFFFSLSALLSPLRRMTSGSTPTRQPFFFSLLALLSPFRRMASVSMPSLLACRPFFFSLLVLLSLFSASQFLDSDRLDNRVHLTQMSTVCRCLVCSHIRLYVSSLHLSARASALAFEFTLWPVAFAWVDAFS